MIELISITVLNCQKVKARNRKGWSQETTRCETVRGFSPSRRPPRSAVVVSELPRVVDWKPAALTCFRSFGLSGVVELSRRRSSSLETKLVAATTVCFLSPGFASFQHTYRDFHCRAWWRPSKQVLYNTGISSSSLYQPRESI